MSNLGFEIDFLPVGDGEKSGDAITLRYGNLLTGGRQDQFVAVVDGGFADTGSELVQHVKRYYSTNRIDLVVSTHPDADHINGLKVVLEEMEVDQLWMHRPSLRSESLKRLAKSIVNEERRQRFNRSLEGAEELEDLAQRQGIPIEEPFAGLSNPDGTLVVVGPSEKFYNEMIVRSAKEEAGAGAVRGVWEAVKEAVRKVAESWDFETLDDEGETTPINNTSVVLLFAPGGDLKLLTADAGIPALSEVADRLEREGFSGGQCSFVQVPHHGSKRNVGPTVLNRVLGAKVPVGNEHGSAFVSVAPDGEPEHPAKKVTNAFRRRGYPVHATKKGKKWHHSNAPDRPDFSPSAPLPFYNEVEE